MAKFNTVQTNFLAGELGAKTLGRVDAQEYFQGAEIMENWIPMVGGGGGKRPGFMLPANEDIFDGVLTDSPRPNCTAAIPFVRDASSSTGVYIIYLFPGATTLAQRLLLYRFNTTTGVMTNLSWSTLTETGFDNPTTALANGDYNDYIQLNDLVVIFDRSSQYPPLAFIFDGSAYYLSYFFTEKLSVLGSTLSKSFHNIPYLPTNIDPNTKLKYTSGSSLLESFESDGTTAKNFFSSEDVGTHFILTVSTNSFPLLITAYISATQVTVVEAGNDYVFTTSAVATDNWRESAWSPKRGWPSCGTVWQDRMIMGGTLSQPDSFWLSRNRNIYFFMQQKLADDSTSDTTKLNYFGDVNDTDPFDLIAGGKNRAQINTMQAERNLFIGTDYGEYVLSAGSEGLSYRSYNISLNSLSGANTASVLTNEGIFFVSYNKKSVHRLVFQDSIDKYKNDNLSEINDDIIYTVRKEGASDPTAYNPSSKFDDVMVWDSRRSCIWTLCEGGLIGITVYGQGKYAFHKHYIADHFFEAITMLPTEGNADPVLMAVVNNGTTSYAVFMPKSRDNDDLTSEAGDNYLSTVVPYCDMGFYKNTAGTYQSAVSSGVLTADWLENNQAVELWADGYQVETATYNSGSGYTLPDTYDQFCFGININSTIKSVPIEPRSFYGNGFPAIKRVNDIVFRLYKSQYLKFGTSLTQLDDVDIDNTGDLAFSGTTEQHQIDMDFGESNQFYLVSNVAGPCTILAVGLRGEVSD